ncbi:siderophore-interacting protein [Rhodococcus sp. NPDC058532]|uniref:siderophore-interacting protein n=1 Tax=Rhodococcus sp. NPDC058532 TaxID=3346540 RepID=UPI00365FF865
MPDPTPDPVRPGYRPYRATVTEVRRLSPHFVRVGFTGPDFVHFADHARDQRVKVVFPTADRCYADLGVDDEEALLRGDWYARWRDLPDEHRSPFRTYTVRAVDPARRRVDIDFVAHTEAGRPVGPGSTWLHRASPGDDLIIVGPDARSADSAGGMDWKPGTATELLLAGDETAAPAIAGILERLPAGCRATALVEVPEPADMLPIASAADVDLRYLPRGGAAVGSLLVPALHDWHGTHRKLVDAARAAGSQHLDDIDVDDQILWDSPEPEPTGDFYAWLAGEAAVIKQLRRLLVTDWGVDRRRVAFMGYWRKGLAERTC